MTNRLNPAHAGVIVSEQHGWRAGLRVIDFAHNHGMPLTANDRQAMELYDDNRVDARVIDETGDAIDPAEWVGWLLDKTESWLQDTLAPEDHYFGWRDGDFRLMSKVESCDCIQCCPNLHCECPDCNTPCDAVCIAEMQS